MVFYGGCQNNFILFFKRIGDVKICLVYFSINSQYLFMLPSLISCALFVDCSHSNRGCCFVIFLKGFPFSARLYDYLSKYVQFTNNFTVINKMY